MGPSHGKRPVQRCRWPRREGGRCIPDSGSKGFGEQRGESHPQTGASAVPRGPGAGAERRCLGPRWGFWRGAGRGAGALRASIQLWHSRVTSRGCAGRAGRVSPSPRRPAAAPVRRLGWQSRTPPAADRHFQFHQFIDRAPGPLSTWQTNSLSMGERGRDQLPCFARGETEAGPISRQYFQHSHKEHPCLVRARCWERGKGRQNPCWIGSGLRAL